MLSYAYVKRLSEKATIPQRKTKYSAGYDLTLSESAFLEPNEVQKLHTGLALSIQDPNYYYIKVHSRSSTIFKWDILVVNGIIDSDYRGEILIVVKNLDTKNPVYIPEGTAIAQLLFLPIALPTILEVPHLPETERGEGGFGSTDNWDQPEAAGENWIVWPEEGYRAWRSWEPESYV